VLSPLAALADGDGTPFEYPAPPSRIADTASVPDQARPGRHRCRGHGDSANGSEVPPGTGKTQGLAVYCALLAAKEIDPVVVLIVKRARAELQDNKQAGKKRSFRHPCADRIARSRACRSRGA
jgi:hypothetical protein